VDARLKAVLVLVFALVLCVGLYLGLYAYSASKVEVRDIRVGSLGNITLGGFELLGDVELYNGGVIPVSVERIDYTLTLEEDGTELARGVIYGGDIPAKGSVDYAFSTHVSWMPSAQLAASLLSGEGTYARLQGTARLKRVWFIDVSVPFEYRIDLGAYLKQFVEEQVSSAADKLLDYAGAKLIDAIKDII